MGLHRLEKWQNHLAWKVYGLKMTLAWKELNVALIRTETFSLPKEESIFLYTEKESLFPSSFPSLVDKGQSCEMIF